MGEERYWVTHRHTRITIYSTASKRAVYTVYEDEALDATLTRITAEAKGHGNVARFMDYWAPRDWGVEEAARLKATAGRLADDFRLRPLPPRPA